CLARPLESGPKPVGAPFRVRIPQAKACGYRVLKQSLANCRLIEPQVRWPYLLVHRKANRMLDGFFHRREFLPFGPLGLFGGGLAPLAIGAVGQAKEGKVPRRKAKACILLFQVGGPYQCDTFDPKPGAPAEVRGPYRQTATSARGVFISEGLSQVAR